MALVKEEMPEIVIEDLGAVEQRVNLEVEEWDLEEIIVDSVQEILFRVVHQIPQTEVIGLTVKQRQLEQ
jgi:hypothetical protein